MKSIPSISSIILASLLCACATGPQKITQGDTTYQGTGNELLHRSDLSIQVITGSTGTTKIPVLIPIRIEKNQITHIPQTYELAPDTMFSLRVKPDGVKWFEAKTYFDFLGKLAPGMNSAIKESGTAIKTLTH